jgi:uncharacterized protein YggL (DUF469 family)
LRTSQRSALHGTLGAQASGGSRFLEDAEAFIDALIDVAEARQLAFGGGAGRDGKLDGLVTRMGRGSAIEEDRAALAAFLAGDDAVVRHEVGALRDAWYGGD